MPEPVLKNLLKLLDYVEPEERKHFEQSGKPRVHIYRDIRIVKSWALREIITKNVSRH